MRCIIVNHFHKSPSTFYNLPHFCDICCTVMFLPEQSSNSTTFHTPAFADNKTKDEDTIFGSLATVLAVVGIIVAIAVAYLQNRQFNNNLPLHVWNAYREFREFEAFELR